MRYTAYLLALISGILMSFQGAIYGQLGLRIGQLETSLYNFMTGSVLLALFWLFFGKGKLSEVTRVPKWTLLGGGFGVIYLTFLVLSVPYVGVGISMVALIIGQLAMSMVIEHLGWLGSSQVRINREKMLAIGCMVIAIILIY